MNKVEIKIAVMQAEIALHHLKPVVDEVLEQTQYDEIQLRWSEYCDAFAGIQRALRNVGAL
jgi:hypothetical protein